uniref:Uncharacterized protein n=1 Tax=Sander lucioperca TaxID=283035 RepID=A0A8C9ZBG9_SANLU
MGNSGKWKLHPENINSDCIHLAGCHNEFRRKHQATPMKLSSKLSREATRSLEHDEWCFYLSLCVNWRF